MEITKGRELKWGSRINKLDDNGLSALHYAARFSRHNILVFLVGKCKAGKQQEHYEVINLINFQINIRSN